MHGRTFTIKQNDEAYSHGERIASHAKFSAVLEEASPAVPAESQRALDVYTEMIQGLAVKDRRWMMKTYKSVFTGKEAVAWYLTNKHAADEAEALELGNQMMELRLFEHVTRDHTFKNEGLFYRFLDLSLIHI